jgi:4'-phosphopantetheinyl transferase
LSVELWCADLRGAAPALREMEGRTSRLSAWDKENAATIADADAAADWLATRVALRFLLERAVGAHWRGVPFTRAAHGKPHLPGAPVVFSLSHVAGLALIGLTASGTIGVDLERARAVRVRAPRRARIEEAGAALNEVQPLPDGEPARFLQAWVRLEAFAKAQGCGIGRLLTRLGIVGAGAMAHNELLVRVGAELSQAPAMVARDLALGEGLYAAVALGPEQMGPEQMAPAPAVPKIVWLPTSIDGLHKLLG